MKKTVKKLYRCTKRYITILESMIALFLLSTMLVIVFGFFHELTILNQESKKIIKERFQKQYVESRLAFVFSNLTNENLPGKIFYFFSTKEESSPFPSLIFTYDNEPSSDPKISGDVLARLFVDHQNRLCLAIWPLEKKKDGQNVNVEELQAHMKIEYLLEEVQDFKFSFLSAPLAEEKKQNQSQPDDSKTPPKGGWHFEWSKDYKQMPVVVKLEITRQKTNKGKNLQQKQIPEKDLFAFVLPSSKKPITFTAK